MEAVCNELANAEKKNNPEVIFAEIIFVPEGREGNVTSRPVFTEYEIPLLASASVGAGRQIPVNDLLVSIQENEIILRSGNLNQRVIPRLSNAHNYMNSPVPVYQFLSAVQHSEYGELGINLGNCFSNKSFLPRIAFDNIIFHRARWFLREKDISVITESDEPLNALADFFKKWNVPRFVSFTEGDNELFIDCANHSYLELLLEEIKRSNYVKLVEWVYDSSGVSILKTDKMPLLQFILPLEKSNKAHFKTIRKFVTTYKVQQTFEPGSEWVYFKIYCGATFSDKILLNVISPAIHLLLKESVIKKAFFIRYADPHYHIRFRLQLVNSSDREHLATVMKTVYDLVHPFSANRTIWKVQLDTYEREIERYGEDSISESEFVFYQDSLLYLNCLRDEEFMQDSMIRFLSAIKNMDKWLTLFKMSVEEKADYCLSICDSFAREYDSSIKFQFDLKYREFKNLLPSFLNSERFENEFKERKNSLNGILIPKENFGSYIHMSMNRWFFTQQRLMEYMCYLFSHKYYKQLLHYNQN
jgi:thiopeptide-type bacteriocin biosynthesis protein